MTTPFVVDHVWQSTWFALLAGGVAFALRGHSPKIRFSVWLSASLKFLVPFALLVSLGSLVPRPANQESFVPALAIPNSVVQIAEPFTAFSYTPSAARAATPWVPITLGVVWALGFIAVAVSRCRAWLRVRGMLRAGTPIELPIPVRALVTPGAQEPGVVGFLRPVLLLPAQLVERLSAEQLDAILAHEMCHVRRRDNLFAAIHMVVEAILWFHPLVWWIGSRMVEERERACDEDVVRAGYEPADYVQGILNVCRFYTESPLPCVSGVTGAGTTARIKDILSGDIVAELGGGKRIALATAGIAALLTPILVGALGEPPMLAQVSTSRPPTALPKWDVISIRPCDASTAREGGVGRGAGAPGGGRSSVSISPGRAAWTCQTLARLIHDAYVVASKGFFGGMDVNVLGGPTWIRDVLYSIQAEPGGAATASEMQGPMLRALLEERFGLATHWETKEAPVYLLTVAKGGAKLKASPEGVCASPTKRADGSCTDSIFVEPRGAILAVDATATSLEALAKSLQLGLDRKVADATGLKGHFDFHLEWSPEGAPPSNAPSLFTALPQQLGLRLEAGRGQIDSLVVDHIEKPSEN